MTTTTTPTTHPDDQANPLLDVARHQIDPGCVMIEAVDLGISGLKGYWCGLSSGPPDRGVGAVSADDKTFLVGNAGMKRVLDTGTRDPKQLAAASMLLLEHGGTPISAVGDLPSSAQPAAAKAGIAAPSLKGDTLSYWSYYAKVGRPDLARSDVDLKSFTVKRAHPGDDVDPIDRAIALLASSDVNSRRAAVDQLVAACTDARAPAALAKALGSSQYADARALAAQFLAKCHDKDAVPALIAALGGDADANVRQWAAASLGELKDARGRAALEKAQQDVDDNVRIMASMALKKL